MVKLQGEEFSFFGLFSMPAPLSPNRDLSDVLEQAHNYARLGHRDQRMLFRRESG